MVGPKSGGKAGAGLVGTGQKRRLAVGGELGNPTNTRSRPLSLTLLRWKNKSNTVYREKQDEFPGVKDQGLCACHVHVSPPVWFLAPDPATVIRRTAGQGHGKHSSESPLSRQRN